MNRKTKKSKVVVGPADLVAVDVFEHARSIMSPKVYQEALRYGEELKATLRLQKAQKNIATHVTK